ncbi:DUF4087 domain-containing protein [Pseudomonas alcaligenes]|uniref:DUF4087 domain-containing protein n=1 Tax=Aquipseudomonas alcaligenes TaxID=43263 RepID=UPI00358F7BB5
MHRAASILLLALPLCAISAEKRCGWLENPTPANLWLIDSDSEWTISTQGRGFIDEASMDKIPTIDQKEFVRTNGNYGFSCVCLNVKTNKKRSEILEIYGGEQLLLKQCLEDSKINKKTPLR